VGGHGAGRKFSIQCENNTVKTIKVQWNVM